MKKEELRVQRSEKEAHLKVVHESREQELSFKKEKELLKR